MEKTTAPIEGITAGQIGRASDRFSERCRVNALSLPKDTVQVVLKDEGDALAEEMFKVFRTRVERRAKMVVRHFKVDRTKTREQMLVALDRKEWCVDREVLATMPTDGPEEGDLYFFPLERDTPVGEIDRVFESCILVPDYYAQMQVNADDPAFADEHPNGMQWGRNNFAFFGRWSAGRLVYVIRSGLGWCGGCWFAGRLK